MLRVASLARQLVNGQRAALISRSVHCSATKRQFLSPPRLLRLQRFTTSVNTPAEVSCSIEALNQHESVNTNDKSRWILYEGEGLDGTTYGQGKFTAEDGKIYVGESVDGNRLGQGKIIYPNGLTHEGEFHCDAFHSGSGSIMFKDGSIYEGNIHKGKTHGQGKMVYLDGNIWQGNFENGAFVDGTITYANGDLMVGEFREGKLRNGTGVLRLKSGTVYEGEFKQGLMCGQGQMTFLDGTLWQGRWEEGEFVEGKIAYPSGRIYEGKWVNKELTTGKITNANGDAVTGEFKKGKIWNGFGVFTHKSGDIYEGEFKEGKMHGQGKLVCADATKQEGEFREGKLWSGVSLSQEGSVSGCWEKGVRVKTSTVQTPELPASVTRSYSVQFTAKNGTVFDGIYLDESKMHSTGHIKYPDGSVYEGEWLNQKKHGAGRLTSAAGEVFEGVFEKDVPVSGKGVLPLKDGGKYEGELVDGERHGLAKITNKEGVTEEVEFVHGKQTEKPPVSSQMKMIDGSVLHGEWREGRFFGKTIASDGRVLECECEGGRIINGRGVLTLTKGDVYEGEFKLAKRHGQGKLTLPDGRTLEGEFRDRKIWNGQGVQVSNTGDVLEGEFRKGKLWSGTGVLTMKDGTIFDGLWADKMLVSGRIVNPNGGMLQGEFKDGKIWNGVSVRKNGSVKKRWVEGEMKSESSAVANSTSEACVASAPVQEKSAPALFTAENGAVFNGVYSDESKELGKGQIKYPDGSVYEGEWLKNKKHGAGRLTSAAGEVFEGVFEKDAPVSGGGTLRLNDGGRYQGELLVQDSGHGKITYPDGRTLEGEFRDFKLYTGIGSIRFKDGSVYEGSLMENKKHGQGKLSFLDGTVWEGRWEKGDFVQGSIIDPLGYVKDGEWVGKKFVKGRIISPYGDIKEGEYKKGKIYNGVRFKPDGRITQRWVEGKNVDISPAVQDPSPQVMVTQPSATEETLRLDATALPIPLLSHPPSLLAQFTAKNGAVFEGVFLDESKMHGKGQVKYLDGSTYEGEWRKDKRHGAGRLTSAAGEVFEGVFEKDVPVSGKGVLPLKDGGKYEGELVEGKRHGLAKITNKEGVVEEVEFAHGKKVKDGESSVAPTLAKSNIHASKSHLNYGTMLMRDDSVLEGEWRAGRFFGRSIASDGRALEAECEDGKVINGTGKLTLRSGDVYEGEFVDGKHHGQGKLTYPDGRFLEGEFREDNFISGFGFIPYKNGSVYEGVVDNGNRHGQGKMSFPDGTKWEGRWEKGELVQGKISYPDGSSHDGKFVKKVMVSGKVTNANGDTQEGAFREGKIWNGVTVSKDSRVVKHWVDGKPTKSVPDVTVSFINKTNGAVFDGVYVNSSKLHAKGQIKYPDGSVYEGEWLKTKKHGAGRLTSAAGEVFEGVFEKDLPVSGKGVLPLKDGGKYEGELVQGKRHGLAKITNKEGVVEEVEFVHGKKVKKEIVAPTQMNMIDGSVLEGEVREGKFFGKTIASDGRVLECECAEGRFLNGAGVFKLKSGNIYEGEFKEGIFQGQGKLMHPDGRTQEGEFREGKLFNGAGSFLAKDGSRFEGALLDGKKHGQGKHYYLNGTVKEGHWEAGELVEGKMVYPNGKVYEGTWANSLLLRGTITNATGDVLQGEFREGKIWTGASVKKDGRVVKRWVDGNPVKIDAASSSSAKTRLPATDTSSASESIAATQQPFPSIGSPLFARKQEERQTGRKSVFQVETSRNESEDISEEKVQHGQPQAQSNLTNPHGRTLEREFREGRLWNGSGMVTLKGGSVYEGEVREGKHHGQGKLTTSVGGVWEGEWKEGELVQGKACYPNGKVYEGEWADKKLVKGKRITANGEVIKGEFRDGKIWNGVTILSDGRLGRRWVEGKGKKEKEVKDQSDKPAAPILKRMSPETLEGGADELNEVKEKDKDGSVYEGSTQDGERHGQGKLTCADGAVWEGRWEKGELVQGKVTRADVQMEGMWQKGFLTRGRMTFTCGDKVTGEFQKGKIWNGRGKLDRYEGEFREGVYCGQGKLVHADLTVFEGEFKEGKIWNVVSTRTLINGDINEREFREGRLWSSEKIKRDGSVVQVWADGKAVTSKS